MQSETGKAAPKTGLSLIARLGAGASLALLLALGAWMGFTRINGAVIAEGKAMVRGKPKIVQSIEGGLVKRIFVTEGTRVLAGEELLEFDATLPRVKREIYRQRLAAGLARKARLEAEFADRDSVTIPQDLPSQLGDVSLASYMAGEQRLFEARREVLLGRMEQLRERRKQFEDRIPGIEARIEAGQLQHELITQQLGDLQALTEQGLVPRNRVLDLQRREAELVARIATARADLAEARTSIRDAISKFGQTERDFREQVVNELQEVRQKVDEDMLNLAEIDERLSRMQVRAPVAGIVHEMHVTTEGGVVAPEQEILKIVPMKQGVEFEVRVKPDAIDSIYDGQFVRLQLPALDQSVTPYLEGEVVSIAPDTVRDQVTGQNYYAVRVQLSPEGKKQLGMAALIPGMPVNAFIQTRARSILDYLAQPLKDKVLFAFREP